MTDNKKRSIQFRRNINTLFSSRTELMNAMISKKDTYQDGEQILGRYVYKNPETLITKIITLVGYVYVNQDTSNVEITFSDAFALGEDIKDIQQTVAKSLYWGEF